MAYELSATQARTVTTTDMVIYNEIDAISRAIITAALAGDLDTSISDGTTMTNQYGVRVITGDVVSPTVSGESSASITYNGFDVEFPAGSDLALMVALINSSDITGLTASKSSANTMALTFAGSEDNTTLTIVNNDQNIFGIAGATYTLPVSTGVAYYNMWTGVQDDRKKAYEFAQVVNHFQNLGYNILAKKNTTTQNTFYWEIYW